MYAPGVDVIVVNYRTPSDLHGFVESFKEVQFEVPTSLHIANVDPEDEDRIVAHAAVDTVEVPCGAVGFKSNIGYATACNRVASWISEPRATVAFFNADTELRPGVLDSCHWNLHQNPKWGVVGPKQVDEKNRITHAGMFGTNDATVPRGWHQEDEGQFDELRPDAITVSGSAYFVNRKCWDELTRCPRFRKVAPEAEGAFLPTQHYYEETWCSYHARDHGWKVAYNGEVSMIHKWHRASEHRGPADKLMPSSREYFRRACKQHEIVHD